jgi:hypothetical protein
VTVEELFRRIVRAHLGVIALCVLIPLVTIGVLETHQKAMWEGVVRIQVDSAPPSSTTEADALSSRVLALATTPRLIRQALAKADVERDAQTMALHHVTAERLGEAPIVEVRVSDHSAQAAGRISAALAGRVTAFMNYATTGPFRSAIADLDSKLTRAQAVETALMDELTNTTGRRDRDTLRLKISIAGQSVNQLKTQRDAMLLSNAQRNPVVVIDAASPDVNQVPSPLPARGALALLLGLVLGLTVAVVLEALRPRLAGPRALARRLQAPVLGSTGMRPAALANAVTLAARRQGVETVVVLGVDDKDERSAAALLSALPAARGVPQQGKAANAMRVPGGADREAPSSAREQHERLDLGLAEELGIRFTDLASVRAADEHTAGVLVVSAGNARQVRLEALEDVLKAARWPVVGIVVTKAKPRGGQPR